jgi:hypothetical protein
MNAQTLISEARAGGAAITISPEGRIVLSGKRFAREKCAAVLGPHRDAVIRLLTPPSSAEETVILNWPTAIGENDPDAIAEVVESARQDGDARRYFLGRACELTPT